MSEVIRADLELRLGEKVGPIEPIPEGHSGFTYYVDLPSGPAVLVGITRTIRSPCQVRMPVEAAAGTSESYSGARGMSAPARAKTGGPQASLWPPDVDAPGQFDFSTCAGKSFAATSAALGVMAR